MRRRLTASPTAGGLALATLIGLAALPAAAQSCGPLVERFAADHSLSTTPPPTASPPSSSGSTGSGTIPDGPAGGSLSPDRLAQSGGVIAPPPSAGDRAVIDPPAAGASNMPTAPALRPDAVPGSPPGGSGATGGGSMGQAARNAQMESLVTAARQAARSGDETRCLESLEEARRLSRNAPGGSGG